MTQKLENKFKLFFVVKKKCAIKGHCGEEVGPSK
jgi:hypothetical protein